MSQLFTFHSTRYGSYTTMCCMDRNLLVDHIAENLMVLLEINLRMAPKTDRSGVGIHDLQFSVHSMNYNV